MVAETTGAEKAGQKTNYGMATSQFDHLYIVILPMLQHWNNIIKPTSPCNFRPVRNKHELEPLGRVFCAMDRKMRFSREGSKGSTMPIMQKKLAEKSRLKPEQRAPDLTDFMNDMFFGTLDAGKKAYDLRGDPIDDDEEEAGFDDSTRSNSSRLTQEWLEEARRMVALSPSRSCDSPSRLVGSPRFAAAVAPVKGRLSVSSMDRRDPLSRSARRQRATDGFSGEILTKSAKHSRNRSEVLDLPISPSSDLSPASAAAQKWFSSAADSPSPPRHLASDLDPPPRLNSIHQPDPPPLLLLPPRHSVHRKSRFQSGPTSPAVPSRRTFRALPAETHLLSPPRRSISSPACALAENRVLSPPRNLVESANRRSISASTCAVDRIAPRANGNGLLLLLKEGDDGSELSLNGFLRDQKVRIERVLNGEANVKAKIVLSGPSNSTSSMVAALCYAWLLENIVKKLNEGGGGGGVEHVVVPVINVQREKMWKHSQAAWLFHHVGLDVTSLFFADEVDLEGLVMAGKLNMLVVGQDVLKTNGEDGSQCTVLTDNFCEDAYDLLETPMLKKLLLAGIVLDTQNLKASNTVTRDAEAVQLLLVGSSPNYRNALHDQLMQDQTENSFSEVLKNNYGKQPLDISYGNEAHSEHRKSTSVPYQDARISVRRSAASPQHEPTTQNSKDTRGAKPIKVSPISAKQAPLPSKPPAAASDGSRGKGKSFLSKWFGFGSK